MTTKAKGTSVRQKITDLATKLDVPFQNIQTSFIIERLVVRLMAEKNLAKHLVFKGGFAGLRVYNSERYTTTVPREREFKEAFDDVVKSMVQLERSFK